VQGPEAEEVVEHLRLDELARLGHADPFGEAGLLHRGGQGDEMPLAFRQCPVQGGETVAGGVGRRGDVGGARLGELRGRADHDDPGIQLEHPEVRQRRRETMREPDVTRPEEPLLLVIVSSGAAEKPHARSPAGVRHTGHVRTTAS
jgi:hypothetical protein